MPDHTHIQLDDEIEKLSAQIAQMGGIVEEQINDSLEALAKRNTALAEKVTARDREVNSLQKSIDRDAAMALTLRQPVSRDLREFVGAIKMSADLERVGDHAKNIAKRAIILNREEPVKLINGLVRMGRLAAGQIKQVLDAYADRNIADAMEVWQQDEEIDELYNSLLREFLTYMMEDPRTIGICTHLLFIAKNLERVGDHATNLAEVIYYIKEAEYPSEDRPKGNLGKVAAIIKPTDES